MVTQITRGIKISVDTFFKAPTIKKVSSIMRLSIQFLLKTKAQRLYNSIHDTG